MSGMSRHGDLRPDGEDYITFAVREAARQAIEDHYRTGDPVVIWRDGKVVEVPPEEIPALLAAQDKPVQREPASDEDAVTQPTSVNR
jgi:hypothetical protein